MNGTLALGILAGGRSSRFGGRDKGWIEVDGVAQIRRVLQDLHAPERIMISANRHLSEYRNLGVEVVPDRWPDHPGPFAGLVTLFSVLRGAALLTVPVDAQRLPQDFVARMRSHPGEEALHVVVAEDDDGLQPLFARYPAAVAAHANESYEAGTRSVREWQHCFPIHVCRFPDWRFGNLNSIEDMGK